MSYAEYMLQKILLRIAWKIYPNRPKKHLISSFRHLMKTHILLMTAALMVSPFCGLLVPFYWWFWGCWWWDCFTSGDGAEGTENNDKSFWLHEWICHPTCRFQKLVEWMSTSNETVSMPCYVTLCFIVFILAGTLTSFYPCCPVQTSEEHQLCIVKRV